MNKEQEQTFSSALMDLPSGFRPSFYFLPNGQLKTKDMEI
jgi:hypothetical protein